MKIKIWLLLSTNLEPGFAPIVLNVESLGTTMRYRVLDLPVKGTGAFLPTTFPNPIASSWGLVKVTASMGLDPIPSPKPVGIPPISQQRETQTSYCAPDIILRDQYTTYADNMGPGQHFNMAGRRLTPLPIPAVSWINTALNAMQGNKIGGRVAMAWPRAFQRWPTVGRN